MDNSQTNEAEKQREYELRQSISSSITENINKWINGYYSSHSQNIGFLLFYPLIHLEAWCVNMEGHPLIHGYRRAITWFIRQMVNRGLPNKWDFCYKPKEELEFQRLFVGIFKCFNDNEYGALVTDMFSYSKLEVKKSGQDIYVNFPIVFNKYNGESIYYNGLDNLQRVQHEQRLTDTTNKYLTDRYINWRTVKNMNLVIDKELLSLCERKVYLDFDKIGGKVQSSVIQNFDNFVKAISFFYYLARVNQFRSIWGKSNYILNIDSALVSYEIDWVIENIRKAMRVSRGEIEHYIEYLTYDPVYEGTLAEFPLILNGTQLFFIPSSFLLNDWHYSITNGHYFKGHIAFNNRDETISALPIKEIAESVSESSNILISTEFYYEFTENGKKINGDLDVALYDVESNNALIIECKWLENVYTPDPDHIKIQRGFNHYFKTQISKHKSFLSEKRENLDNVFNNNPCVVTRPSGSRIYYLLLDKRAELHQNNNHMMSLHSLINLLNSYRTPDKKIRLSELIDEIENLKTETIYMSEKDAITIQVESLNYHLQRYFGDYPKFGVLH